MPVRVGKGRDRGGESDREKPPAAAQRGNISWGRSTPGSID